MKIKGKVSRTFHSTDNGFKIIVLEVSKNSVIPEKYRNPDYPMRVSVVGNLKNVQDEYIVEITGEWEHRESGRYWPWQFKVERYTVCDFETPCILVGIISNLNSFGRTRAKRLVETYGTDIVHIIEKEPQALSAWEIKPGEMEALSRALKKYRAAANLKEFLSKYGIEEQVIDDIHERWGLSAVEEITKNPYALCKHKLVPFIAADKIAKDCDITADNPERVDTVLLYVLNDYAGSKGHTFLRTAQLPEDCNSFLKDNCEIRGSLNKRHIEAAVSRCAVKGDVVIEGENVYSKQRYESETVVANILASRIGRKARYRLDSDVREEDITWLELHGIRSVQVEDVLHESQMSIMRLCEYLENVRIHQCFAPNNAITDWRDYLHAAKTIGVDLTDNKARYPSSLKREHDRAVAKQKLVLDAKKDEFFQMETERYGRLYSYKTDAYMIIPPKNMKDLFEEGRKLNHCVGSYSDRIVEGKSCIMFIRKTEEPDKPYFTIEINRSGSYVEQLRANSNRRINHSTEKELVKFLKEWSKKKNVALNSAA